MGNGNGNGYHGLLRGGSTGDALLDMIAVDVARAFREAETPDQEIACPARQFISDIISSRLLAQLYERKMISWQMP